MSSSSQDDDSPEVEPVPIPAHTSEPRAWRQEFRGGTREDRLLDTVTVSLPPHISSMHVTLPSDLARTVEAATLAIRSADHTHGKHLGTLAALLIRAESVASSKIESVEASIDDYARALHGSKANESATSMVAASAAVTTMVESAAPGSTLTCETLLDTHTALMREDPAEASYAGTFRDVQNWIGGSDYSPRGALFVPPPPESVATYMSDLLGFVNQNNHAALVQAAIAHAQFESIHPFTDGNGRVGRALISAVLRRRDVANHTVIPVASALVAQREQYFDALGEYRQGDARPIVRLLAVSADIAARESAVTGERLARLPDQWLEAAGRPRAGSATRKVMDVLLAHPVLTVDDAANATGVSKAAAYRAVSALATCGVLRPLMQRTRNQVWAVSDLLDELADLGTRIAAASR